MVWFVLYLKSWVLLGWSVFFCNEKIVVIFVIGNVFSCCRSNVFCFEILMFCVVVWVVVVWGLLYFGWFCYKNSFSVLVVVLLCGWVLNWVWNNFLWIFVFVRVLVVFVLVVCWLSKVVCEIIVCGCFCEIICCCVWLCWNLLWNGSDCGFWCIGVLFLGLFCYWLLCLLGILLVWVKI